MSQFYRNFIHSILFIGISLLSFNSSFAQANLSSDELFQLARKEAFDNSSYPKAVALLKRALEKSPDYADIRIFLGRIYTWTDKVDSANAQFTSVLTKNPQNEDALSASFDLNYWNNNLPKALDYATAGLKYYPQSEDFILRNAKVLNALQRPNEALAITQHFLVNNPQNIPVRTLQESIIDENLKNKIGVGYSFTYFDKRFDAPWHQPYITYGRQTKYGPINFSYNYANRFNTAGSEFEVESYPHIDTGIYMYIGGGISQSSIFSKYRLGFTVYKNLGSGFEGEAGLRYLQFTTSTTIIVTGLGRYIGNNYIGLRSYIIPYSGRASFSFNLLTRFFLGDGRNDYASVSLGTGVSPDDRARRFDVINNLKSFKAGADYSRSINKRFVFTASGSIIYEEYFTNTHGNQYSVSAGILRRF